MKVNKKKKRKGNEKSAKTIENEEEEVSVRVGTISEHYLNFVIGVMDFLDISNTKRENILSIIDKLSFRYR